MKSHGELVSRWGHGSGGVSLDSQRLKGLEWTLGSLPVWCWSFPRPLRLLKAGILL